MVFDIEDIPEEGLDFQVDMERSHFHIDQSDCCLSQDVKVQGTLNKYGEEIYFKGRIETELTLICSRCLEKFQSPVKSKVEAHFVPEETAGSPGLEVEIHSADIEKEFYKEKRIAITQPVHDQILLAVPVICLCKEDCKGLCSNCGKNLNQGDCACAEDLNVDPRLGILKTLKNQLK